AGLAAAQANNSLGFAGVAYNAHVQAYKIFADDSTSNPCPSANTADEAQAINDAVSNHASVISLSLGSPQSGGSDATEQAAIENAIAAGVTVVAANGNEYPSSDGNQPDYPAAYPGVIAVGASAVADDNVGNAYTAITSETVASYSNSSPTLLAPGGDASGSASDSDPLHWITGYYTTTPGVPGNSCTGKDGICVALFNGTSQATPQVSGAIALMIAEHGSPMAPATVKSILTSTADLLPGIPASRQGAGRLNVAKAVAASK
ncbi:MAG TPA: S8 family serine peptidase, partial [Candidatus Acidoferrum sp.]|nr:S8 family serine peptidase [Candidatus Acidoferrum sp.]